MMNFDYEFTPVEGVKDVVTLTVTANEQRECPPGCYFELAVAMYSADKRELHSDTATSEAMPISASFRHQMITGKDEPEKVSVSCRFEVKQVHRKCDGGEAPIVAGEFFEFYGQRHVFEPTDVDMSAGYHHDGEKYDVKFAASVIMPMKPEYELVSKDVLNAKPGYSAGGESPTNMVIDSISVINGSVLKFVTKPVQLPFNGSAQKTYFNLSAICLIRKKKPGISVKLPVFISVDSREIK